MRRVVVLFCMVGACNGWRLQPTIGQMKAKPRTEEHKHGKMVDATPSLLSNAYSSVDPMRTFAMPILGFNATTAAFNPASQLGRKSVGNAVVRGLHAGLVDRPARVGHTLTATNMSDELISNVKPVKQTLDLEFGTLEDELLNRVPAAFSTMLRVPEPISASASQLSTSEPTLRDWLRLVITSDAIVPLVAFYAIHAVLAFVLMRVGITFPASVFGMISLFLVLLAIQLSKASFAERTASFVEPACRLFRAWLPAIFAPGFIRLPLDMPALSLLQFIKFMLLLCVGAFFSAAANAAIATCLAPGDCGGSDANTERCLITPAQDDAATAAGPPVVFNPFPQAQQLVLGASFLICASAYLLTGARSQLILNLSLFSATLGSFATMSTLCSPSIKLWLHPFIACSGLTWLVCVVLGNLSGHGWRFVLQSYASKAGAGAWILQLMGPSVLSFAFSLYGFRVQLQERLFQILGTIFAGSLVSLFATATAARAVGLSPVLRLASLSRTTLSPLALETSKLLGGEPALGMFAAFVTALLGISFGKPILQALRVEEPVTRGLALGGATHGGAMLALNDEPRSFPFTAIMTCLGGACTVALLSLRPVRTSLITVALGKL